MHGDDSYRGYGHGFHHNKPYSDNKNTNYSPSTSYNYNPGGTPSMGQHPRRRVDRFKRDIHGMNNRLVQQNNIIIKLLKEISAKLPGPVGGAGVAEPPANGYADGYDEQDDTQPQQHQQTPPQAEQNRDNGEPPMEGQDGPDGPAAEQGEPGQEEAY